MTKLHKPSTAQNIIYGDLSHDKISNHLIDEFSLSVQKITPSTSN